MSAETSEYLRGMEAAAAELDRLERRAAQEAMLLRLRPRVLGDDFRAKAQAREAEAGYYAKAARYIRAIAEESRS